MSAHLLDCIEDDYNAHVDLRRACRNCGRLAHLEDSWCARCNGTPEDDRNVLATQRACRLAREAQQRRRPDLFDENGVWAPFRGTR